MYNYCSYLIVTVAIDTKQYLKRQASEVGKLCRELEGKVNIVTEIHIKFLMVPSSNFQMTGSRSAFVTHGNDIRERLVQNVLKVRETQLFIEVFYLNFLTQLQENRRTELEALPDIGSFVK